MEELERRLLKALDWDSERTPELRRFEAEVNVLRDNIHEAISSGASGRTRQGLEIIQAAMLRAIQIREKASDARPQSLNDLFTNVPYGQEWDILMRSMFDLISASSDTLNARTKQEIHNLIFRLLQDFCEIEELPAVQSCLNFVIADWLASLASPGANGTQDQGYILLRLSEVAEFALPSSGRPPFQESAMGLIGDTFIKCAKAAVDRGAAEAATHAVTFLQQTFEFESGDDLGGVFRRSRELGLLVLLAWIFFRKDNQFSGSEIDGTVAEIESAMPQSNMWELARRAKETEDHSTLGWGWWESTIKLSRHWFGFASMPTYVNLVALKLASTRQFEPPSPPGENDVALAHNFEEMLRAIRGGTFQLLGNESTSINLENAERIVSRVLDEDDRRRQEILSQTPLDEGRIERFRSALGDLLGGSTPRLVKILMDGTTAGIVRKVQRREVIDKWWFVHSDVHAEPEMLARSLAQVLKREEEEAIISTILAAAPPVEVRSETMNDELPDWLTSMKSHSLIVTNSWDAYYQLIPGEQFTFANDDMLKTASGIPVLRLYDNRSPFVAAFLTPRAIRCKLSLRRDELSTPNSFVIDKTILVSVRELNEPDLMAFTSGSGTSQNDYRAKALIEASEELTVEVDDSSFIKVWALITEDE